MNPLVQKRYIVSGSTELPHLQQQFSFDSFINQMTDTIAVATSIKGSFKVSLWVCEVVRFYRISDLMVHSPRTILVSDLLELKAS
jgi:hypothetical protein